MKFFCVKCQCRDLWHQVEGDQRVPFIWVVTRELQRVGVAIYRSVSVFFIAEFNFTLSFLLVFLINGYQGNKGIKKNTEICSVLKFTVLCDVIVLLFWFLQNSGKREAVCSGFWRMPSSRVTSHAVRVLNCGSSTKNAWIKGMLL